MSRFCRCVELRKAFFQIGELIGHGTFGKALLEVSETPDVFGHAQVYCCRPFRAGDFCAERLGPEAQLWPERQPRGATFCALAKVKVVATTGRHAARAKCLDREGLVI